MAKAYGFSIAVRCVAVVTAFALASCSARHDSGALPQNGSTQRMAVVGDDEADLLANKKIIEQQGQQAAYVTITEPQKAYTFSVYAKMLRSDKALIVRGYGRVYFFPLNHAAISYAGGAPIDILELPHVSAPALDTGISNGAEPGSFKLGNATKKRAICPDCVGLMMAHAFLQAFGARFHSVLDPWQKTRQYSVWKPIVHQQPSGPSSQAIAMGVTYSLCTFYSNYTVTTVNLSGYPITSWRSGGTITERCFPMWSFPSMTGSSGGGGGTASSPPPATIQTSKGTAKLTNCTSQATATKQALAEAYTQSANSGGNEYGSAVYDDGKGNYYIVTWTSSSEFQIDMTGLTTLGLNLDALVHDHWGYDSQDTPPVLIPFTVDNWQAGDIDQQTGIQFSLGDETAAENYQVPIWVVLGTVEQTFFWPPAPKNPNGTWNIHAPASPMSTSFTANQSNPNYHC